MIPPNMCRLHLNTMPKHVERSFLFHEKFSIWMHFMLPMLNRLTACECYAWRTLWSKYFGYACWKLFVLLFLSLACHIHFRDPWAFKIIPTWSSPVTERGDYFARKRPPCLATLLDRPAILIKEFKSDAKSCDMYLLSTVESSVCVCVCAWQM